MRRTFHAGEQGAIDELNELDVRSAGSAGALHAQQVATLTEAATRQEVEQLGDSGQLPEQALGSR